MIQEIAQSTNAAGVSELLDEILRRIHTDGPVNPADFEKLALIKHFHPTLFHQRESELLFLCGLFYKTSEPQSIIEEVYSIYADSISKETGRRFTPVQAAAYKNIKEKIFFSFSAPTSAGKSYLFRELITTALGDIVIVVPSRALIAEYLSVVKALVDPSVLVLQFIENINIDKTTRRVFIVTPERGNELFQYKDIFDVELVLFDEAQLSEEEIRGVGFDAFVRRVSVEFPNATKVFAHPFVKNPEAQLNKHHFPPNTSSSTSYEQNAVGKIFLTIDNGNLFYFSPYEDKGREKLSVEHDIIRQIMEDNGTILIYASKAKLYSKAYVLEYRKYLRYCPKLTDPNALKYIEELRSYIGAGKSTSKKSSLIVKLMERGIVVHHGSMPLKMRLIIEEFVRSNHAKLCFATSTLQQGINMPFDVVFIDNYNRMDVLTLKNLIGRAGRSTNAVNRFEYGYTIIDKRHLNNFCKRINEAYMLKNESSLDLENEKIDPDNLDLIQAIKENSFDEDTRLTKEQVDRIDKAGIDTSIELILNQLFIGSRILTGKEYYELLNNQQRQEIKDAFKTVYISHLRRNELTSVEQSILSTAIPILLWHIQGKTFKEVLALRYSYLTCAFQQRKLRSMSRNGEISDTEALQRISDLKVRFSQAPSALPNRNARKYSDFANGPVNDLDYDTLVFDTYDYIDKVISLSLSDPLCAAFRLYFKRTNDERAEKMEKYIKYGTIDATEIWLLRYGFAFEDIIWIKPTIKSIDERQIVFNEKVDSFTEDQLSVIHRYL